MEIDYTPATAAPLNRNLEGLDEGTLHHYAMHYAIYGTHSEDEYHQLVLDMRDIYSRGTIVDLVDYFCSSIAFPAYPWVQDTEQTLATYLNFAANYFRNQARTREEGMPNIPFFSLPKTASSFVNNILANGLDIPYTMISWHGIKAIKAWAEIFTKGPGVLHDHLHPENDNAVTLKASGLQRAILHVRDPRQMLLSLAHHSQADGGYWRMDSKLFGYNKINMSEHDLDYTIDLMLEDRHPKRCAKWLDDWHKLAPDVEIFVSRYEKLHAEPQAFLSEVVEFCGGDSQVQEKLAEYWKQNTEDQAHTGYNFRSGKVDEWKKVLLPRHLKLIEEQLDGTSLGKFYLA
tara:strand:- start:455 stop:1489 length:1035 start_codon:yes stop_codon:yes gene_type:complete